MRTGRFERYVSAKDNPTPAGHAELERLRAAEQQRQAADPYYITHAQAAALTPEQQAEPLNQARIAASRDAWPEQRMPMSAVGMPEPGEGETITDRSIDASTELFDHGEPPQE